MPKGLDLQEIYRPLIESVSDFRKRVLKVADLVEVSDWAQVNGVEGIFQEGWPLLLAIHRQVRERGVSWDQDWPGRIREELENQETPESWADPAGKKGQVYRLLTDPGYRWVREGLFDERGRLKDPQYRSLEIPFPEFPQVLEYSEEPAAGLEENQIREFLEILEQAAPQGSGMLVIEAGEISRRTGLAEFVARVPRGLADRLILFGAESVEAKEIAVRNGIAVVNSDKLSELAFQLKEADRVGYVGDRRTAMDLSKMLSMEVTPFDPETALDQLLRYMEYPEAVLEMINAAGAEELFAGARAA